MTKVRIAEDAVSGQVAARSTLMKANPLQVLLVEDKAGDVRLLREMFSKEKPDSFELTHLLRMSEAEIQKCLPLRSQTGSVGSSTL